MLVNVRGSKIEVTPAIKDYIAQKLERLDRYFSEPNEITANVVIKVHNLSQIVEVTVPTTKFTLRREVSHEDLYAAIDLVIDKLERQIRKSKTKLHKYKDVENFEMDTTFIVEDNEEEVVKIAKRKNMTMKPMDEEEAIMQMEMLGHSFFVFKNAETNNICVLYLRKDGNYGIIETN